jgi:serine protease Do
MNSLFRVNLTPDRRRRLAVLVALLACPLCPIGAAAATPEPPLRLQVDDSPPARAGQLSTSFAPIVRKVAPSVVSIFTTRRVTNSPLEEALPWLDDPLYRRWFGGEPDDRSGGRPRARSRKEHGLGSGVIVTADGYILSNNHVVEGAEEVKVALADERRQFTARVIGRDQLTDVALLKVDAKDLPALTIADSDKLEVGDVVLALGNPFGVGQSVSHGIVSAVRRGGLGLEVYEDFIQTDAPINPGNSGGALVDAQGRLVGISTAIATRTGSSAGVGFAVPANMARSVLEKLLKEGRVARGFLGIGIQDLTPELAKEFQAPTSQGALVTSVEPESAAAEAGLKSGDIVVEFAGKPIADSRQLRLLVSQTAPGTKVDLKALRRDKTKSFTVTLKELPEPTSARHEGRPDEPTDEVLKDVAVADLTPASRRQLGIPDRVRGALVSEVAPDSAAYEAGLRPGDVIQEINQKPIRNAEDAVEATRHAPSKRVLLRVWSRGASRFLVVDEGKEQ